MSEFEEFWQLYPRKVGKGQARKAWLAATLKTKPSVIIAAAKQQSAHLIASGLKYCPHPSTWLNGERWEDEVVITRPAGKPAPRETWKGEAGAVEL